jgi:predicted helicase
MGAEILYYEVPDYLSHITIEAIPSEAYDYIVNGKSAIDLANRTLSAIHKQQKRHHQ